MIIVKIAVDDINEFFVCAKIQKLMAQFEAIRKTEQVGEYFVEGVVNLKKLYSIDDLVTAARIIVDIE